MRQLCSFRSFTDEKHKRFLPFPTCRGPAGGSVPCQPVLTLVADDPSPAGRADAAAALAVAAAPVQTILTPQAAVLAKRVTQAHWQQNNTRGWVSSRTKSLPQALTYGWVVNTPGSAQKARQSGHSWISLFMFLTLSTRKPGCLAGICPLKCCNSPAKSYFLKAGVLPSEKWIST